MEITLYVVISQFLFLSDIAYSLPDNQSLFQHNDLLSLVCLNTASLTQNRIPSPPHAHMLAVMRPLSLPFLCLTPPTRPLPIRSKHAASTRSVQQRSPLQALATAVSLP